MIHAPTVAVIIAFLGGNAFGWSAARAPNSDPWWPAVIPMVTAIVCGMIIYL